MSCQPFLILLTLGRHKSKRTSASKHALRVVVEPSANRRPSIHRQEPAHELLGTRQARCLERLAAAFGRCASLMRACRLHLRFRPRLWQESVASVDLAVARLTSLV
jgi:hypothetical protein